MQLNLEQKKGKITLEYDFLSTVRSPLNVPLCRKLDAVLGPQMTKLASDISEQYSKRVAALK